MRFITARGGLKSGGEGMTWEEIGKKYERDNKTAKGETKTPKLEKNWDNLVKSTDKLVWLFSLSNGGRPAPKNG